MDGENHELTGDPPVISSVLPHGHNRGSCQSRVSESLTCDEVGIVDLFHGLMDGENHDNYNELTDKPPAMSVRILNTWDLQTCFSNDPHFLNCLLVL